MYELVKPNDPILITKCEEFDFTNPPFDSIEHAKVLVKIMRDNNGLGLASNQIGIPYRVFALRADPNKVLYNPIVVMQGLQQIDLDEGCLSFPGLFVNIKRSQHIRIRYTQPNGETTTEVFTGISARVCQHEMDHLDGILFYNRASRWDRDKALKDYEKWKKQNSQHSQLQCHQKSGTK
jgi:peptide deformylase